MGLLNDSIVYDIAACIILNIVGILFYFKWKYTYWTHRNLPHLKPCIPFGTMENPFRRSTSFGNWLKKNYDELKARGHKHGGIYNFSEPIYLPIDPEYVKNIVQSDFQHFVDRAFYYNEKDDPLSAHLLAVRGQKWRNLRTKLTPTFTTGKMKMMFDILLECSLPMVELMEKFTKNHQEVDIKEIVSRFTTDVIGSTAFGVDCNSFKSPDAEFRKYGKKVFDRTKYEIMTTFLFISRPKLGNFLKIRALPKDATNFFGKVVKDTVKYREANNVVRKDMLQILIDIKNKGEEEVNKHDGTTLTVEEIAAQAFVFFIAGFETTSTAITYCLYELASNKTIQDKVRQEIKDVLRKYGEKITYESIKDMHYMTQVVEETLRMYPPVPQITRICVKDYKVPNTDVVIEKGTNVFISVLGLQYDSEHYPEPEKFDPDRFTKENKVQRHTFSYVPFGEGPRSCIAKRFGMMQTKVGLAVLLNNFEFTVNEKTKLPLEIEPYKHLFSTKGTLWLDTKKIE